MDEIKNKKTMSLTNLTKVELKHFQEIFNGLKDEFLFCVTSYDRELIDYMNKSNFIFIVVSEVNVEKTKKIFDITENDISKNKCLIITEVPLESDKLLGLDNSFARVWSGLTRNVYIGSENRKDYLFNIYEYLKTNKLESKSFKEFISIINA